ncbi:hypothetical protein VUR80DRAFT_3969 [Thermomyces stellatus]
MYRLLKPGDDSNSPSRTSSSVQSWVRAMVQVLGKHEQGEFGSEYVFQGANKELMMSRGGVTLQCNARVMIEPSCLSLRSGDTVNPGLGEADSSLCYS